MRLVRFIIFIIVMFLSIIYLIALFEIFIIEKGFQKKGIKFLINFGTILKTKQTKEILSLILNPIKNEDYAFRRIIIYKYKWQFIPFYLLRILGCNLAKNYKVKNEFEKIMGKTEGKNTFACYNEAWDLVEVFEFNIKRLYNNYEHEAVKILMISILTHELRHREQFLNKLDIKQQYMETDADEYAIKFCNDKKNEISEILDLEEVYTLKKIES